MRRRPSAWFTVSTRTGVGWYRTRAHAMSAARWVARDTGNGVDVRADGTGQTWRVSPADVGA